MKSAHDQILFSERQRFSQWWLWLFMLGLTTILLYGIYKQIITGELYGTNPVSDTGLIIATGLVILLVLFFGTIRLETQIKEDGIYVRFFPLHITFRHFAWDEIRKTYLRQYSPIKEFGGWGIRYELGGRGKTYNVKGNIGLQLEFIDNKKLLIGTDKPGELEMVLNDLGKLNK